jgi:DNA-binding Lrp family transcriptional regulator
MLRSIAADPAESLGEMTSVVDALDDQILTLLHDEPRAGLMEVARRLGVARGTVQARLARLQERGVVRSFGPELDPARMGYPLLAFVSLQIRQGRLDEAVRELAQLPELLEAVATSGPSDLLCRVVARDTEHLQEVINRLVAGPAVQRSTSTIALSRPIRFRTGPLLTATAQRAAP